MDKAKLEELKGDAEKHCADLFAQINQLQTELERTRGDYRTYDSLLLNWVEGVDIHDSPAKVSIDKSKEKK